MMSQGVKGQKVSERKEKRRELEQDEQLRRYHNDILAGPDTTSVGDSTLPPDHHRPHTVQLFYHYYYII